ncbi:MAG: Fur family transcriptional regulator [Oscillospiraceae bacterium]
MEKATRYSRKREAILDAIRSTDTHPSADWVYQTLRPAFPDLSLGTVYRNLARFKEEGLVVSVGTVQGQERFDAIVTPHTHFVCQTCGAVMDLPGLKAEENLDLDRIARQNGVEIDHHVLILYGTCPGCSPKDKRAKPQN